MITEIPLSMFVQDITNIYYYVYLPDHELATKSGKVYMHRYVMAKHMGRPLSTDEVVHHKDEDRTNNDLSNLELLSHSDHSKMHHYERWGEGYVGECHNCGAEIKCGYGRFNKSKSGKLYCSSLCLSSSSRLFEVDAEVLADLVWQMSTIKVAKLFGVSDVAIGKRCKLLGINKPPRGYWRKVQCGVAV